MCVFVCSSRPAPATPGRGSGAGGCAWALVCSRAQPLLAAVLGRVCVYVRAPLVPRHSWLGCAVWACVLGSGFGCASPLLIGVLGCVCVCACAPLAPRCSWRVGVCLRGFGFGLLSGFPGFLAWVLERVASCVRRVRFPSPSVGLPVAWGCAGVAVGGVCPPLPFGLISGGGVVACRDSALWCRSWWLTQPWVSRLGCTFVCLLFFFLRLRPSVVCVGMFWVSLLPVGRCSRFGVAGFRWVVLRCLFGGSRLRCCLAGRPLVVWVGGLVAVGLSRAPQTCFFGGGVCPFLPVPSLFWCTHWSAFGVVNRVAVGACVLVGLTPAPWVGWVMYTLGSAAPPFGLGSGSASRAVAPGGFFWLWVRGAGVFDVPPPPRCRY